MQHQQKPSLATFLEKDVRGMGNCYPSSPLQTVITVYRPTYGFKFDPLYYQSCVFGFLML